MPAPAPVATGPDASTACCTRTFAPYIFLAIKKHLSVLIKFRLLNAPHHLVQERLIS